MVLAYPSPILQTLVLENTHSYCVLVNSIPCYDMEISFLQTLEGNLNHLVYSWAPMHNGTDHNSHLSAVPENTYEVVGKCWASSMV